MPVPGAVHEHFVQYTHDRCGRERAWACGPWLVGAGSCRTSAIIFFEVTDMQRNSAVLAWLNGEAAKPLRVRR